MAEAKKDVAKVADTKGDVVAADDDFFATTGGTGLEDFGQGDIMIPRIAIIQALSKELEKGHAKYVKGAEVGMYINRATGKLYDGEKGFFAIPLHYAHHYQAWAANNGGPRTDYKSDPSVYNAATPDEKGKRLDPNGDEIVDSNEYFIFIVDPETGDFEPAIINMSGTQTKKSRKWGATMAARREKHPVSGESVVPAMWFYSYHFTTQIERNDSGSWYGYAIGEGPKVMDLPGGKKIFTEAGLMRKQILTGEVKASALSGDEHIGADGGEQKAF